MPGEGKPPPELLQDLSALLGLSYEPQDWGIVNADGGRLEEFIAYFEQHNLAPTQRFDLAELVLASANERLLAGGSFDVPRLVQLCHDESIAFDLHLEYWRGLGDDQDFPLGGELRRML